MSTALSQVQPQSNIVWHHVPIAMERKRLNFESIILFILFLLIARVRLQDVNSKGKVDSKLHRACPYLNCDSDDVCVHRKFHCKDPPCPSMLYCAKSQAEILRGPSTCDTVRCTSGHTCMMKVRQCRWDEKRCKQQIARCVTLKEYHEGPASCAGYKCPQGNHCILRESFCVNPPCKLLRSCAKNKEVRTWFGKCRSLDCPSEFECFLRRPETICSGPSCKHTPDCVTTTEDEVTNEHCRGWICPRKQKCSAEIVGDCKSGDCNIKRACQDLYEVPLNTSQANDEKTKILDSWLNHLMSKTELDAIEQWIKNAQSPKDFKQFQDWLRSVKDILGPDAYNRWLEDILSSGSRDEEFRKWLRASQDDDKLDDEKPIFPGEEAPQDQPPRVLTENRYPNITDTLNAPPSQDKNTTKEDLSPLLRDKNLTDIIEKLLLQNRILLPYTALETALLNNLRESNRSPFFDYILKYPPYTGEQDLRSQLPKNGNVYSQPYVVLPVGNMKVAGNSRLQNYGPDLHRDPQNQQEKGLRNGKPLNQENTNVPQPPRKSSFVEEELSSLWNRVQEDLDKKLPQKGRHKEDPVGPSEDKRLMDKAQYFADVPDDFLEKLIKSLQLSSLENTQQTFDDKPIEAYHQNTSLDIQQNEEHNQNHNWNLDYKEMPNDKNSKENSEFSSHGDGNENITNNFEPIFNSMFFNKPGSSQTLNHSDQLNDDHSKLPSKSDTDETNDELDLDLFFELNKETLLPYIQALMDAVNEENAPASNTEQNAEESSMKTSFLNNENPRRVNDVSDEIVPSKIESKTTIVNKKLHSSDEQNSHLLNHRTLDESLRNIIDKTSRNSNNKEIKGPRTTGLIYAHDEPAFRSIFEPPSYGAGESDDIAVEEKFED